MSVYYPYNLSLHSVFTETARVPQAQTMPHRRESLVNIPFDIM